MIAGDSQLVAQSLLRERVTFLTAVPSRFMT
jgi:hypothetical protein